MKKPVRLLLYGIPVLLLALLAVYQVSKKQSFEFEEGEEEESAAEVLGPMDYWGSLRSFPNPNGEISAAKYAEAFEHVKRMPSIKNKVTAQSRVQASNWVSLGPMNFSGRILCMAFHPTNKNIMWAGSCAGGLWKSTNGGIGTAGGGINWSQVQTGFPITSVPAIAVNPTNTNEIYIGTGEVYNTGGNGFPGQNIRTFRGSYGIGILKSSNGGTTWNISLNFTNSSIKGVQKILFDPTNTDTVFAATSDGLYRSSDAGANWTLIHSVALAMDMQFAPGNSNILYVTYGDFASAGTGIYKCTNALSPSPTFTKLAGGLPSSVNGMIRISICPDNANIIYASVGKIPGTAGGTAPPSASATYGLYKSTNGGTNWALTSGQPTLSSANYIQNQGWYAHDVLAGTDASGEVYVSEIDMCKSSDRGATWANAITQWGLWDLGGGGATLVGDSTEGKLDNQNYAHADHHRLYFAPTDPSRQTVYVTTDGGIFRSTDGGANWKSCNGGLNTVQIYHRMSSSTTNSNYMLCGLQDNATLVYQGSTGCQRVTGGDGFYTAIDPTNDSYCYGTYTYGTWYRSNGGITGTYTNIWDNSTLNANSLPSGDNAAFVAPIVIAPSNPNIMYVGTVYLRRFTSIKNANTTTAATNTVMNGGAVISNANAPIMAIGVSKTYADSIYIATAPASGVTAKVFRSTNGGTSITNITGILPDRYISFIAVDPNNSKRIAVSISGFGTSHVYFSNDGGTNWRDVGGTGATALPDLPANVVMFDPTTPTTLYVGNDLGVFVAQNITTGLTQPTWYSYNSGLGDGVIAMDMLVAPNGKLRLGTLGRGLWENNMVTGSLPVAFESFQVSSNNNGNLLTWVVSAQKNVSNYEIEYSNDAVNFATVGSVPARTGGTRITYNFLHKISNNKNGYYRIKVVDLDGEVTYSAIEEVKAQQMIVKMTSSPNPTPGIFKLTIPASARTTANLRIYDQIGRVVESKKIELQSGINETNFDLSRMSAGNYQIVCESNNGRFVNTVIKK